MSDDGGSSGGHGGPVWLLTYCDLITLLVAFFVMLISLATINVNKCKEDLPKIKDSFEGGGEGGGEFLLEGGKNPVENIFEKDLGLLESSGTEEQSETENLMDDEEVSHYLSNFVNEGGLAKYIHIEDVKIGCKIKMPLDLCFEKGKSVLKRESYKIFNELGIALRTIRGKIVIDANVGKAVKADGEFTKESDLSLDRAANICDYLVTKENIEPQKIAISGSYTANVEEENIIAIMIFKK